MPRRIAVTSLNATTIDILNTIRANASYEYQSLVPTITSEHDIPKVGEILYGYPAMANQFLSALINRIALVKVNSATFNNAYAELKKGMLEYGETVEEVFVGIAKAREFSVEKAAAREFQRTMPDVRSAFHIMNWRVQYPVTIQNDDLKMAFLSINGVQDLIARIVDQVYTAAEYDEFLLFKYLIIKAVAHGQMKPVNFDSGDIKNAAVAFRGTSNLLTFMKKEFNASGVTTATPKADQYIFMDANFNAQFDVNVLASAFNMEKADFMGRLKLIDDFTTFDNDRFDTIRGNSDMIESVTAEELAAMANVKAVLVDKEWFQVYDNLNKFTEVYVSSGLYWNYNYHVWKTVSSSPFSNAVAFIAGSAASNPATIAFKVQSVDEDANAKIFTLVTSAVERYKFIQTEYSVRAGVAVHPYGAIIIPDGYDDIATYGGDTYTAVVEYNGALYSATIVPYDYTDDQTVDHAATAVGDTITFSPVV